MPKAISEMHVLVVDDHNHICDLIKSILFSLDVGTVSAARDGDEAFQIFCEDDIDIIITDWQMSPCDGLELLQRIRLDDNSPNPYIPVILMTAYSDESLVITARDMGVTEIIVKPFNGNSIRKKLKEILNNPREFIATDTFFGPDRRRRKDDKNSDVKLKRKSDPKRERKFQSLSAKNKLSTLHEMDQNKTSIEKKSKTITLDE